MPDPDLWERAWAERPRLLRIARARTSSVEDAEDCVHDAMLKCVAYAGLDPSRLPALLTTVTIRNCVDRHRAQQYRDRVAARLANQRCDVPSPEEAVVDRAEAAWVADLVRTLPERQRAVVEARAERLSGAEVASRLRITRSAAESLLSRTRSSIRAALGSTLAALLAFGRRGRSTVVSGVGVVVLAGAWPGGPAGPAGPETPGARPPVQQVPDRFEARPAAAVTTASVVVVRQARSQPRRARAAEPEPEFAPPPSKRGRPPLRGPAPDCEEFGWDREAIVRCGPVQQRFGPPVIRVDAAVWPLR